jgi:2'-5' RNA ligase
MNARTSESLRLFFALWPDAETAAALMRLQNGMQGRLIPYANLHITLAFLGPQPAALLPELKGILTRLPRTEITLSLDRVGYFRRNRIAWAGMHAVPEALLALQQHLAGALQEHKVPFDNSHDFKPHITLARDAAPPPDTAFDPIVWHANHVALVESTAAPKGSSYRILASRAIDKDARVGDVSGKGNVDAF